MNRTGMSPGMADDQSLAGQVQSQEQELQRRRQALARTNQQLPASGSWTEAPDGSIRAGYGNALR